MSHYPIVLIPSQIQRVKSELPPKPVFSESLPQQPGEEPKKVNNTVIAVETAAVLTGGQPPESIYDKRLSEFGNTFKIPSKLM